MAAFVPLRVELGAEIRDAVATHMAVLVDLESGHSGRLKAKG